MGFAEILLVGRLGGKVIWHGAIPFQNVYQISDLPGKYQDNSFLEENNTAHGNDGIQVGMCYKKADLLF